MFGARGLIRVALSALVVSVALLCCSASALAAAPETPTTELATGVTATEATLHGVLDPNAPGEAGSYQFSYEPSPAAEPVCAGGTPAPEKPVADAGAQGEAKTLTVKGLEPSREYAFCIVAYSLSGGLSEPAFGAAVPFKTLALPPAVDSETAVVTSTAARLEAQVNPNNQATKYGFEYGTSSTLAGATKLVGGELAAEFGDRPATASQITGLTPGAKYYYRVSTKNASSEETKGAIEHFATVPVPHTDAATAVTATTAILHGHFTPDAEETLFSFDYNIGECANGPSTAPTMATGGTVEIEAVGLQPNATYTVCMVTSLVTSDEIGSEVDRAPVKTFTTPAAPPTIDSEGTSNVTPFEATLEAQINPNNQKTTYKFEYSTSATGETLNAPVTTLTGATGLEGYGDQTASVATGDALTSGETYYYRVIAENAKGEKEQGKVESFTAATAEKPIVDSESTAFLTGTSTNLTAQVNPNYQTTTYTFEYATGTTGKQLVEEGNATTIPGGSIPAGFGDQLATARLNEALTPNTTYYYRVLATNAAGTTPGPVEAFTTPTPPQASTGAAELVGSGTATVSGMVNPEGQETYYSIQYGPTTSYGQSTSPTPAGSEATSAPTAPIHLDTLLPSTTYHYRLVAMNATGEMSAGADMQFTTTAAPPAPTPPSNGSGEAPPQSTSSTSTAGVFPNLTAIAPALTTREAGEATPSEPKPLTRAQKLSKALKACKRSKGAKRSACEKSAHRKYGPVKRTKKKAKK